MSTILRCSFCAIERGVRHFNLSVAAKLPNGQPTRHGAGRIDLCAKCWAEANSNAAQRPRRRTPRKARLEVVA